MSESSEIPQMPAPPGALVNATITFANVSKWFGSVVAVSDVTFAVGPGVTALLGPNGAGKSTVLRMLVGLTPPSQGEITVLGRPPRGENDLYREIGLVPQQESVLEAITGFQFVTTMAELSGVASPADAARAAIDLVELDPTDARPLRSYSKGMRQRIKVAAAVVHNPQIVVLDEPLNGLDPRQRLRMIELFRRLGNEGKTVIISSHVLDEVERFGSRILMIADGRLAAEGDFHAIRALMDDRPHQLRVRATPARPLAAAMIDTPGVVGVHLQDEGTLAFDVDDVSAFRANVLGKAVAAGVRITEIAPLDEDLESVFRYLVGRRS